MKTDHKIITLLLSLAFLSFSPPANPVEIEGHLKKSPGSTLSSIARLIIYVKGDEKVLAKAMTDNNGGFHLHFTPAKENDIFCTGPGMDTLLIETFKNFKGDMLDWVMLVPAPLKKNAAGKILCPKCNREDKVELIEYLNSPRTGKEKTKTADSTFTIYYKSTFGRPGREHLGKYYCERDKVCF